MSEQSQSGPAEGPPLLIVDAANVVGSVPDGWWKDRKAAAERLRDALMPVAKGGLASASGAPGWAGEGPLEVAMVVEGAARGVADAPGVRVVSAEGSGDDRVVRLVATVRDGPAPRRCLVVSADR
jgi:hypothetical protein